MMKNIFSMLIILGLYASVTGCTDDNGNINTAAQSDNFECDEPVMIDSEDNQPVPGFLVYIDTEKELGVVEDEFATKYKDITVFSSFPKSNSFYAHISDESLKHIQCEADVTAIAEM